VAGGPDASGFGARLTRAIEEGIAAHRAFAAQTDGAALAGAEVIREAVRAGRQVLVFGNGGSATDAQHFAAELVVRFAKARRAVAALALTTDGAVLTAVGNDLGFEAVFARQIDALGRPGDVAVAITTSGRSPNVTTAVEMARAKGLHTVALTGRGGGDLAGRVDVLVDVPGTDTARIQEVHRTWIHAVCEWIEADL
jgi:D-sedoheptulose 7-phosphate isomerase